LRRVLLLVGLTMFGAMLFASAAVAQDPCPDPNFPRETPDGCQASDLPDVVFGPGTGWHAEQASTATPTPVPTAPAPAASTPTATRTATATATPTATATASPAATQTPADEQEDERENEQAASEERESRDETTSSEGSQVQTRSQDKTMPPETDEASARYPVALAGITFVGLIVSGLLAARAILPWRG
jgi:hypothetical protein